jgi:PKD repeat protein
MKLSKTIFWLLVLVPWQIEIFSQVDREFWFAIPKETSGHGSITTTNNVSFKITAMSLEAHVTISMPTAPVGTFATRNIIVPAGQTVIEVLANSFTEFAGIYANNAASGSSGITGKTSRGILITSDNDITVYYDYDNYFNRDLFSLKGKNSLGTDFYTPFQTIWHAAGRGGDTYTPKGVSSIEIIATEDNTIIDIYPTVTFQGRADALPFQITLNRGETYSLVSGPTTITPAGTRIKSRDGKKIAVVTNDDSVQIGGSWGCRDILGDQLVPVDIIGSKYVVMTGDRSAKRAGLESPPYKYNDVGEQIFVTATQPGTTISFRGRDGTLLYQSPSLGAGQSDYFTVDIDNVNMSSIYVTSNDVSKKFYVFHATGIECELGGAILPPITNCTGSNEVSFYRSSTVNDITVNLMIPYSRTIAFNDPAQSHNFFSMVRYNGTNIDTIPIPGSWFESNDSAGWAVLKMANRDFNGITFQGRAHKIINTKDFFHLGMTNGTSGQTNKYGYFSSFNATVAEIFIPQSQTDQYRACYGDTINLVAKGGLSYTWHYGSPSGPPLYLSDPKSATPEIIKCPVGNHEFYVEVQQAKCFGTDTLKAFVTIAPVVTAWFETSAMEVCSPDTILFKNQSINADVYTWRKQVDAGPVFDMNFTAPNSELSFKEPLNNPSNTNLQRIKYTLIAESLEGCAGSESKTILVKPRIVADYSQTDTIGCNPLTVSFSNNSGGNVSDSLYYWNFGDQGTSIDVSPTHIFKNYRPKDTTYNITLIAKSPFYCTDTVRSKVTIHPYIFANYAVDTVMGCSPLQLKIQNGSLGAIARTKWEYGNKDTSSRIDPSYFYTYRNTGIIDSIFRLKLSIFNTSGCVDSLVRIITAYPEIKAKFTADVDTGCTPLIVKFANNSNAAADSFYWDFGDGTTSYLKNPFREYNNLSVRDTVFKVKLKATTSERCPGYDSTVITIRGLIDPRFSLDTSTVCAPFNMTIKNKSVYAPGAKLTWNFGDLSPDSITSGSIINHLYRNPTPIPLNLNIQLNLTGTGNCTKTLIKPIRLFPEIKANFNPDTAGCNPLPVNFRNLSTNMVAKSFLWTFGDSASSVEKEPFHVFSHLKSTDQVYPVKLIAQSEFNCKDSITKNVTVYSYIDARFAIDKGQGCSPLGIAVTDSSSGGITSKLWDADGTPVVNGWVEFVNNTDSINIRKIRLVVNNNKGCFKEFVRNVNVYPQVHAQFTLNKDTICNGDSISFLHTGAYPDSINIFQWEFGDNSSSFRRNATGHKYYNYAPVFQHYTVKLKVLSDYLCSDSMERKISIYPLVKANFSVQNATGCADLTVQFTNASSPGANTFLWIYDYNGNTNPNGSSHAYTYPNPTGAPITYKPLLVASHDGKCFDKDEQTVEVYPRVTADFTEDTLQGCHPLFIEFKNQSTNANYFDWSFGDKGTDLNYNTSHTYGNFSNVDSVYTVKLKVTSEFNCTDSLMKTVTIFPKPKARFYVENTISCPPFDVPIYNLSEAADTFKWNYGDGNPIFSTTSQNIIIHRYFNTQNIIGPNTLQLVAETHHGCTDNADQTIMVFPEVIANFEPDTAGCSPLLVTFRNTSIRADKYYWEFGDNSLGNIQSPTHKFFNNSTDDTIYTVKLTGTSKYDCISKPYSKSIKVYPQPVARFLALPTHMEFPVSTVNIENQTNAGNWSYLWSFGDGNTSSSKDPFTHTYNYWNYEPGYQLKLTVQSSNCIDSAQQSIRVFPAKPIPGFKTSANGCVPTTIQFTDTSKYANTYHWDFDYNGATSSEQNPEFTYDKPGKYNVKLTITGDGGTDYTYREVNIYPLPVVDFIQNPVLIMLPDASTGADNANKGWVQFTNNSKFGTHFKWDFGDGGYSNEESPRYQYKEVGTYDVTLNAWTNNNCFDSITHSQVIKVIVRKEIKFPTAFTPSTSGPNGGAYTLKDQNNDVFHPHWDGIIEFQMEIYDRWGEKIFETNDINVGWDGYYKGKLCKSDVYVCKAKGRYADLSTFNYVGDVTLIR